jgi:Ca2+-binding EF-hand superfamily protein
MSKAAAWALAVLGVAAVGLGLTTAAPAHAARAAGERALALVPGERHEVGRSPVLRVSRLRAPRVTIVDRDRDGVVTAAEAAAYYEARFAAMEADGDGVLSEAEFVRGGQSPLMRAAAADPLRRDRAPDFTALDLDGDNRLSAEEFLLGKLHHAPGRVTAADADERRRQGRVALFAVLDAGRDGVISREEFAAAGARYFATRDADGDGRVTIWEFRSGPAF